MTGEGTKAASAITVLPPTIIMAIYGLWVINKAGGLVYQRSFADGLAQLTSNEYLVLAGTLHGIHAITSRLSPMGSSSGAQVIEGESFKMTILLTPTGTKFVLLTSPAETSAEATLQKVYEVYADDVMKNPFHTPEMPIRSERFDSRIGILIGNGLTTV
ncbi:Sybindin-like protein [Cylindrobasidium torrendii FP15055 ss-10]|uniref:Trafficking protein particle complex subunit n=1 Tax=Cylindrobasidium torrendii FP15055 ss-10 TaxID=1314674 RepID=A0A0D7BSQ5_9AGAR|nr:Sybindin-like protein [Cylindrobasidium torrendii FP15055 ss-10]